MAAAPTSSIVAPTAASAVTSPASPTAMEEAATSISVRIADLMRGAGPTAGSRAAREAPAEKSARVVGATEIREGGVRRTVGPEPTLSPKCQQTAVNGGHTCALSGRHGARA